MHDTKTIRRWWLLSLAMAMFACAAPERGTVSNRKAPAASQFDFWLGEWELTWGDSGSGTNTITAILDSMVIAENFDGTPSMPLIGKSYSVYVERQGKWKQTWVDNSGGYLDFVGEFVDGKMIFSRDAARPDGTPVIQRMVWHNIAQDELDWNWEASTDGGMSWNVNWKIHYRRK